jgi:hypothetical protein
MVKGIKVTRLVYLYIPKWERSASCFVFSPTAILIIVCYKSAAFYDLAKYQITHKLFKLKWARKYKLDRVSLLCASSYAHLL